MHVFNCSL